MSFSCRPASATAFGPALGMYGLATLVVLLGATLNVPAFAVAVSGLLVALLGLLAIEILDRVHVPAPGICAARPRNWRRTGIKLAGLAATVLPIALIHVLLAPWTAGVIGVFLALLPAGLILMAATAPILFIETDRRMTHPEDAYYHLGRLVLGKSARAPWGQLRTHLLGWLIKAFFFPLMVSAYFMLSIQLCAHLSGDRAMDLANVIRLMVVTLILVDLLGAVIGYSMTFRLLGTHIRSANSLVTGWIAALVCYPPFLILLGPINGHVDYLGWIDRMADTPALLIGFAVLILFLEGVYTLATVNFGLRFSNLTHRGIVTGGLYRWTKHPAYIAKNAFWWVMALPALIGSAAPFWTLVLLTALSTIYYVRARTEELHLGADPEYQNYTRWMETNGLFAPLTRFKKALLRRARRRATAKPDIAPTLR